MSAGPESRMPGDGPAPRRDLAGARVPGGLCPRCTHVKVVTSAKGSTFLKCQLSATDPRFPKYPPQPVVHCTGFESCAG